MVGILHRAALQLGIPSPNLEVVKQIAAAAPAPGSGLGTADIVELVNLAYDHASLAVISVSHRADVDDN